MKILFLHNHYGGHSGESTVLDVQEELLRKFGHEVRRYTRSSAELKTMRFGAALAFFTALYNPAAERQIIRLLDSFRPDVVHVHNLYPLISPAALRCIHRAGIPVVMTVHNYRLVCPNGLFYNRQGICERCSGGREWHCALGNCEESLPKSIGYAARNAFARMCGHYAENVDAFLCLTDFQKAKLVAGGFPERKCHVLPNFLEVHGVPPSRPEAASAGHGDFLFIGRLNRQKGVDIIVEAARRCPEFTFRLAGSVDTSFFDTGTLPPNVTWLGVVDEEQKLHELLRSSALVFASRSYEGFPMVFLEAMQQGVPIIAPRLAGYPEIVRDGRNGWLFSPEDPESLALAMRHVAGAPEEVAAFGRHGHEILCRDYSPEVWYRQYIGVVTALQSQR